MERQTERRKVRDFIWGQGAGQTTHTQPVGTCTSGINSLFVEVSWRFIVRPHIKDQLFSHRMLSTCIIKASFNVKMMQKYVDRS